MPTAPADWAAAAAANTKIKDATAALKHADGLFPSGGGNIGHVGERFVQAFIADGMKRGIQTTLVLNLIRTKSVADYNALVRFLNDKNAVTTAINVGFSPFRGAIANSVPQGASSIANSIPQVGNAVVGGLHNAADVGAGFLSALTNGNTWLRVAEVTLGIVLVVVGLVKLAPAGVTKNVKTIGKVAALL